MSLLLDSAGNWVQSDTEFAANGTPISVYIYDSYLDVPFGFTGIVFFQKSNTFATYVNGQQAISQSASDSTVSTHYSFESDINTNAAAPGFIKFDHDVFANVTVIYVNHLSAEINSNPNSVVDMVDEFAKISAYDTITIADAIDGNHFCKYQITAVDTSDNLKLTVSYITSDGDLFSDDESITLSIKFH